MSYQKKSESSSQFIGVYWHKVAKKWAAQVTTTVRGERKTIYLGLFVCPKAAAREYDKVRKELGPNKFGPAMRLNFNESK